MNIETRVNPEKSHSNIERATANDLPSIQELTNKLFEYEIENGFDDNIESKWSFCAEGEKELQDRITSKNSIGLVNKVDGKAVGYLIGLIRDEETGRLDAKYAELEHMFVSENERGKGIGEALVEAFKSWVKNNDLNKIKVNVSFDNKKAIEFYKKVGLAPADVTMSGEI